MIVHGVDLIDDGDMVIRHLRQRGSFEPVSMAAWLSACGPAVDVGAYTGLYAIAAARQGARVMALEPNPAVCKRLRANVERNGASVEVWRAAAGAEDGEAELRVGTVPLTSAGSLVGRGRAIPVTVMTLDGLLEDCPVSRIKIDVEGYEAEVIRGAAETIARCRPLVITEALDAAAVAAQTEVMRALGYGAPEPADGRNLIWRL